MRISQLTVNPLREASSSPASRGEQFTVKRGFSTLLIIVVVAVVGVAAVLAFGVFDVGKLKTQVLQPKVTEDQTLMQLKAVGTSDEVPDIEKDLLNTDLETIDAEISEIDRELQSDLF